MPERRTAELHEAVKRRLEEHNIRYTAGRRSLVTTLVRIEGPESTAELHRRMRGVPLSSLYRNLVVLDEAGVVQKHHDADGLARYELAEWLTGHHHHVVCVDCGTVADVSLSDEDEEMIGRLARQIAERARYRETGHNIEVEGVCPSCQHD